MLRNVGDRHPVTAFESKKVVFLCTDIYIYVSGERGENKLLDPIQFDIKS